MVTSGVGTAVWFGVIFATGVGTAVWVGVTVVSVVVFAAPAGNTMISNKRNNAMSIGDDGLCHDIIIPFPKALALIFCLFLDWSDQR